MPRRKLTDEEKQNKPHRVQFLPGRVRKLPDTFDVATCAAILKIPVYTIYNWIKTRELPVIAARNKTLQIEKREFVGWSVIKNHMKRIHVEGVFE